MRLAPHCLREVPPHTNLYGRILFKINVISNVCFQEIITFTHEGITITFQLLEKLVLGMLRRLREGIEDKNLGTTFLIHL